MNVDADVMYVGQAGLGMRINRKHLSSVAMARPRPCRCSHWRTRYMHVSTTRMQRVRSASYIH